MWTIVKYFLQELLLCYSRRFFFLGWVAYKEQSWSLQVLSGVINLVSSSSRGITELNALSLLSQERSLCPVSSSKLMFTHFELTSFKNGMEKMEKSFTVLNWWITWYLLRQPHCIQLHQNEICPHYYLPLWRRFLAWNSSSWVA